MSETGDRVLRLRPFEDRNAPARPILDALGAGIILILQPKQTDMASMARWKTGYFDVIADQVILRRYRIVFALEESLLEIPTGPPREHIAHLEVLADDVAHHVLRENAFGGLFVVCATGSV